MGPKKTLLALAAAAAAAAASIPTESNSAILPPVALVPLVNPERNSNFRGKVEIFPFTNSPILPSNRDTPYESVIDLVEDKEFIRDLNSQSDILKSNQDFNNDNESAQRQASSLEFLNNAPQNVQEFVRKHHKKIVVVFVGGVVVAMMCYAAPIVVASETFKRVCPTAIATVIESFPALKGYFIGTATIAYAASTVIVSTVTSYASYKEWRKRQSSKIAEFSKRKAEQLGLSEEISDAMIIDPEMKQFFCPITQDIPTNPVVVYGNSHEIKTVFEEEFIRDFFREAKKLNPNRPVRNPATRLDLPFHTEEDIVVDMAAQNLIKSRMQHYKTLFEARDKAPEIPDLQGETMALGIVCGLIGSIAGPVGAVAGIYVGLDGHLPELQMPK